MTSLCSSAASPRFYAFQGCAIGIVCVINVVVFSLEADDQSQDHAETKLTLFSLLPQQEKTKGECIEEASVTTRGQTKGGLDEEWKPQTGLLFEDDKDNGLLSYARHRVNENAGRFGPNLRPTFNGLRERIGAHFQRYFKLDPASPARGGGMPFGGRAIPLGI